eukprot:jgi/Mesvir1/24914/Mv16902-RA.2
MGISGLHSVLKSIARPAHVSEYAGQRVVVDAYAWLHKGAFMCSRELCLDIPTRRHIDYCLGRLEILQREGVIPIMVFDGGFLPMKKGQEDSRARSREENLRKAAQLEQEGNTGAAFECYQKAVDISPHVAYGLIKALKERGIEFVVAPYEADAQMAFLALRGAAHAVITEDSDLVAYGCERVLFKMDKHGHGCEVRFSDLPRCKEVRLEAFNRDMVLTWCILAGCDYLPSLEGIGVKTAHSLVARFKDFRKVIRHLRFQPGVFVPPEYEPLFQKAIWTFKHQRVFDAHTGHLAHVNDIPSRAEGCAPWCEELPEDTGFLGSPMPEEQARRIAEGELCPITLRPFTELDAECAQRHAASKLACSASPCAVNGKRAVAAVDAGLETRGVVSTPPLPPAKRKVLQLPVQKNTMFNYADFKLSPPAMRPFTPPRAVEAVGTPNGSSADVDGASLLLPAGARKAEGSGHTFVYPAPAKTFTPFNFWARGNMGGGASPGDGASPAGTCDKWDALATAREPPTSNEGPAARHVGDKGRVDGARGAVMDMPDATPPVRVSRFFAAPGGGGAGVGAPSPAASPAAAVGRALDAVERVLLANAREQASTTGAREGGNASRDGLGGGQGSKGGDGEGEGGIGRVSPRELDAGMRDTLDEDSGRDSPPPRGLLASLAAKGHPSRVDLSTVSAREGARRHAALGAAVDGYRSMASSALDRLAAFTHSRARTGAGGQAGGACAGATAGNASSADDLPEKPRTLGAASYSQRLHAAIEADAKRRMTQPTPERAVLTENRRQPAAATTAKAPKGGGHGLRDLDSFVFRIRKPGACAQETTGFAERLSHRATPASYDKENMEFGAL